ncbi:LysR family transcriptional regulator [Mesobacterium sp. TK19101]|uniref:LysR family transcriptional regulator n=1 Tax=Mesobacterium hydrothermale TaxID=3111907 RepID=A0ABU6HKP8_9RHOB|nr:LysR family transcriptional regulator [Mesobacterium sp. TK19101]MEC3863039.1 LysR family transcriptional regulator [Mesobacterium sp. TK19101]
MKISQLRTLLAIRDNGSLSRAAQVVHLSHSALSTQMTQLEQDLGSALFVKGRRPVMLTAFGLRFCVEAEDVLGRFDALRQSAGGDRTDGTIRAGFVPTTQQTLLPVVLRGLGATFPKLRVQVTSGLSGDLAEQVARGHLDLAVMTAGDRIGPEMEQTEIAREPLCVVAPPDTAGDAESWLGTLPYIAFARDTRLGQQIETGLSALKLRPETVMEIDSLDTIEALVREGLGCSILPQRLFAPPLQDRLTCLPFPQDGAARRLALLRRRDFNRPTVWAELRRLLA